jgi:transcriptional regulator with XRE-family HTH domain
MRSKITKKILDETPEEARIFVRKYGDIVVRVNQLLREKGFTQKDLAGKLDKTPSEISKWLKGDHNFTLRSIAKLEAILGEPILVVPKHQPVSFIMSVQNGSTKNDWVIKGRRATSVLPKKENKGFVTISNDSIFNTTEILELCN